MIKRTTIFLGLLMFQFAVQAQQRCLLDTKKSKIFWKIETVGKHNGFLPFNSGRIDYSAKDEPVAASFSIDVKGVRSLDRETAAGREEIDRQLRSSGFLNAVEYPVSTFSVTGILPTSVPSVYRVTGNLTIKGITKLIEFNAAIKRRGELVDVKASFKIARALWNIDFKKKEKEWSLFSSVQDMMVADDIQISLDLTLHK